MKNRLENYITNHYYELLAVAKKYTKNDDWSFELLNDVLFQILSNENLKIGVEDKEIKYYIIRCLMVNWCYPSSTFYRKNKKPSMDTIDISEALGLVEEETGQNHHQILDLIESEYSELEWNKRLLFDKYLILGSLKKVSTNTSIPLTNVHKIIKETKNTIKANTFKKLNNE